MKTPPGNDRSKGAKRRIAAGQIRPNQGDDCGTKTPEPDAARMAGYVQALRSGGGHSSLDSASAGEIADAINAEEKTLVSEQENGGHILAPMRRDPDFIGMEHLVWTDPGANTVTKETYGYKYGHTPLPDASGTRFSIPSEYLERLALHDKTFGTKTRMLGVSKIGNSEVRIRTQQDLHDYSQHPSIDDLTSFMNRQGFIHSKDTPGVFYHEKEGVLAVDAVPKNFVQNTKGEIYAVDLMVRKIPR